MWKNERGIRDATGWDLGTESMKTLQLFTKKRFCSFSKFCIRLWMKSNVMNWQIISKSHTFKNQKDFNNAKNLKCRNDFVSSWKEALFQFNKKI